MHGAPKEPQRGVLDDMLILQRDQYRLRARRLQSRGVDRYDRVSGLIEDEVVRYFRGDLEPDMGAELDDQRVAHRADDDVRNGVHRGRRDAEDEPTARVRASYRSGLERAGRLIPAVNIHVFLCL